MLFLEFSGPFQLLLARFAIFGYINSAIYLYFFRISESTGNAGELLPSGKEGKLWNHIRPVQEMEE